jgi:hypothetical protein
VRPYHEFTEAERARLYTAGRDLDQNPYSDHAAFAAAVAELAADETVVGRLAEVCAGIRADRGAADGGAAHVLRNCPIDDDLPELDPADPVAGKYAGKKTFVGEAFLELVGQLCRTPRMAYGSRNSGDFFTDVVAIRRFSGMQTGFSDSELVYHNDRTAHWARADYISLLGLRCPPEDIVCTSFADGRRLLALLEPEYQKILREPLFVTSFDAYSRATNTGQQVSEPHPILEADYAFRYTDTGTRVAPGAPPQAKDALIAMKEAVVLAEKQRHVIRDGDLLLFANQTGLHSREKIEVSDTDSVYRRWLLKTYAFRDEAAADRLADRWLGGVRGLIDD